MKFNASEVSDAILKYTTSIGKLENGPITNKPLFRKLCSHFASRKQFIGKFKVNLYFQWFKNENNFADNIREKLLLRQSNSINKSTVSDTKKDTEEHPKKVANKNTTEAELTRQLSGLSIPSDELVNTEENANYCRS